MKLFYSVTSPYARKTRLMAREKGLQDRIEEIPCNPHEKVPGLSEVNPLGRVPTLVLDDGSGLYDSPVICQYLDSLSATPRLIPETEPQHWDALRWEALADGILDAAYNSVMEGRRPLNEQSQDWIGRWHDEIRTALDAMERDLAILPVSLCLSHLALAAALGYLDFRLPYLAWRDERPAGSRWYDDFSRRPSMRDTRIG